VKILIIDPACAGLNFALRCQWTGHDVKIFIPKLSEGELCHDVGNGMVSKVEAWQPHMNWAELIIVTGNDKYATELERFFQQGYPIVGTNKVSAALELDRGVGQDILDECGIETLDFKEFSSYDKAIEFLQGEHKAYVSKPWGGAVDKSLSYVPPGDNEAESRANLICRLERWRSEGVSGKFILQEKIDGTEMAAGTWFGPGGFCRWINETWEEKRLMNDGYGPNTGEMGTVLRYTKRSKLFEEVVRPLEQRLHELGFVGNVDVSCMIDKSGRPWPMEFTMRFGWPAFNLMLSLHQGDPAEWLLALLEGRDTLECSRDLCCGVVMSLGDYPWGNWTHERCVNWPIRGLNSEVMQSTALTCVKAGRAPTALGGKVEERDCLVSAGQYVLVAMGQGATVEAARKAAYRVAEQISWPPHTNMRTDIGCRMEKGLRELHRHGYATDIAYGN
jgi:phosphoribosylamine--glycine ligase